MDTGFAKMRPKPSKTLTYPNYQLLQPMESILFAFPSSIGTLRPETFIEKEIKVTQLASSYRLSAQLFLILFSRK